MKRGLYLRDWGNEGLEIGVFKHTNFFHWFSPYGGYIETEDFVYSLNLDKWIYIGEL